MTSKLFVLINEINEINGFIFPLLFFCSGLNT